MKSSVRLLSSMIGSFLYNRTDDQVIALCEELIKRLKNYPVDWTEDGNIVYSALVIAYGDYGTSPRSGWFRSKDYVIVQLWVDYLKNEIEDLRGTFHGM